jgi:hypothetical protein
MKKNISVLALLLVNIATSAAFAKDAQCVLQVRGTGEVGNESSRMSVKLGGNKPYRFMQEYFKGFMFQFAFKSDGPADGPVGKVKSIGLLIQQENQYAESTASYPTDMKEGSLSLVVPKGNAGIVASMECSNP